MNTITLTIPCRFMEMARLVAPDSDMRWYINGIYCTPSEIVATEGHVLLHISDPWTNQRQEFPPFLIPRHALKNALKEGRHCADVRLDVEYDAARCQKEAEKAGERCEYPVICSLTDANNTLRIECGNGQAECGEYPDWNRIICASYSKEQAAFDLEYVELYHKLRKVAIPNRKGLPPRELLVEHNGNKPARFHFPGDEQITFIIAPLNSGSDGPECFPKVLDYKRILAKLEQATFTLCTVRSVNGEILPEETPFLRMPLIEAIRILGEEKLKGAAWVDDFTDTVFLDMNSDIYKEFCTLYGQLQNPAEEPNFGALLNVKRF